MDRRRKRSRSRSRDRRDEGKYARMEDRGSGRKGLDAYGPEKTKRQVKAKDFSHLLSNSGKEEFEYVCFFYMKLKLILIDCIIMCI